MIIDQGAKIMKGKELVNSKGQIVDQENFNKALFSLMDDKFKGGMDLQAGSIKGLWSTVTGSFKTTLATMSGISATGEIVIGGFFDKLKNGIKGIIAKLEQWQKDGTIQEWSDKAGQALTTFWDIGSKIFDGLIKATKWVIDNFGIIGPIVAGVLAGFLAFQIVTTIINTAKTAMALFNLVMAGNPIALVVLAVAALVAGGILLYKNWDIIKEKAGQLWEAIGNAFTTGINHAIDAINFLIKKINLIPGVKDIPLIIKAKYSDNRARNSSGDYIIDEYGDYTPSFAIGTRYLPSDMMIQAHEGEMIVPRSENPYANSGGGTQPNGGAGVKSVTLQLVLQNGKAIAEYLIPDLDVLMGGKNVIVGRSLGV
jgi:hypothetical protein